jgi:hypothetical protein
MSPGWQASIRQIASRVENRMALALPVLRMDRFWAVMPARPGLCLGMGVWGPDSGREFAGAPSLTFSLNDPRQTPPEALLTEICLPLAAVQ